MVAVLLGKETFGCYGFVFDPVAKNRIIPL